jgi:hypothetical protein
MNVAIGERHFIGLDGLTLPAYEVRGKGCQPRGCCDNAFFQISGGLGRLVRPQVVLDNIMLRCLDKPHVVIFLGSKRLGTGTGDCRRSGGTQRQAQKIGATHLQPICSTPCSTKSTYPLAVGDYVETRRGFGSRCPKPRRAANPWSVGSASIDRRRPFRLWTHPPLRRRRHPFLHVGF